MSPTIYKDCLWTLARNQGRNPNPLASPDGKSNITNLDRDQWTSYLNDALIWAWSMDEFSIWPWLAGVATPTLSVPLNGATLNGTITVTVTSTAGLAVGMGVTGNGIPANATIATITPATTITLSIAATISGTVNLTASTNNTFPASLVQFSDFITPWLIDPRTYFKANNNTYPYWGSPNQLERYRMGAALDVDQVTYLLHPQFADFASLTGQATVFYRVPPVQWTWTPVDTTATYNTVGTLVYDDVSGNVFKSIATAALGNALGDAAKWTAQTIPTQLRPLVLMDAERRRLLAQNAAQSETALQDCMSALQVEIDKALGIAEQTQKAAPWLCRSYENPNGIAYR